MRGSKIKKNIRNMWVSIPFKINQKPLFQPPGLIGIDFSTFVHAE